MLLFLQEFINMAIKFMVYNKILDKKGQKIWHKVTEGQMGSLLCDCAVEKPHSKNG